MRKRQKRFLAFISVLLLTAIFSLVLSTGPGGYLRGVFELVFLPVQQIGSTAARFIAFGQENNSKAQERQIENFSQSKKIADLVKENSALRDQFQVTSPSPKTLLPAAILSFQTLVPGVSKPEKIIIGRGERDGVKSGMVVVYKDVFLGVVTKSSQHLSEVSLTTKKGMSLTSQTKNTQAIGVIKGEGNGVMKLDNVVMNEKLEKNDLVMSKGEIDFSGIGIPPGLIVGKIISIEKSPSALFQTADVVSPIDLIYLTTVFVQVDTK